MTSTLKIDTIEPEGATTTLTVGETGQNTVIAGAGIKANVAKDAGTNAIFTSNGSGVLSGVNAGFGSGQVLLSTQTASNSASISFTSGLDSTYKKYVFIFNNINAATDGARLSFQCSTDGGSNYNLTMTTTYWRAAQQYATASTSFTYSAAEDQAQGTAYQEIMRNIGNVSSECGCGELHLYNPASTTFVKNFYTENARWSGLWVGNGFVSGYFNTTSAINAISFKMVAGNINDGKIKMYGIK